MQKYQLVPPDGGWGWLILFGATLVNILVPGTIKSFGVLFVEFLENFKASPSSAAWIPALCYFLYSSLGPVSSILSVKYSYRTVTIIGGTFAAFGMIISYFASSVTFLYISYGVFVGTGAGLSFPPTVYIVTSYFVKLRGLANGVCISGSAFGSILLPPILRYLLEEYGYRGAILIMGGITLNVWMAALFYEPVEQHMKRVPIAKKVLEDIEEEDAGIVLQFNAIDSGENNQDENNRPNTPNSIVTKGQLPNDIKNFDNNFIRSASAAVVPHLDKSNNTRKISTPVKIPIRNPTFTTTEMTSTPSLNAFRERGMNKGAGGLTYKNALGKSSPSTSSFQYISTPYHGSTLSFQPNQFSSHLSLKSIANSIKNDEQEEMFPTDETQEKPKEKFFDLSLLKDPLYLIILISNCTNAISYTNFIILLPAYAISLGYDKSLSAYLISIVSTTDLIGRIGGSALSDLQFIPKTWYFIGGLALSGVSLSILPLTQTYAMLGFCCAVFGLASGTYVGITAVIMADLLGTDRLTSSYGISLFVNGLIQLIGPPLCGLWYEHSKTYAPLFTTLGVTLVLGASLWGLLPFIKRKSDTKENQSNYNDIDSF